MPKRAKRRYLGTEYLPSFLSIHQLNVILPSASPALDATLKRHTLHLRILSILNMVIEPARCTGASAAGRAYPPVLVSQILKLASTS